MQLGKLTASPSFFYALTELEPRMRLCFVCKKNIDDARLDAIPETRLCATHGQEIEKFGGEFRMSASQERTSKQGSLKLNYGGIATTRERNQDAMDKLKDEFDDQNL